MGPTPVPIREGAVPQPRGRASERATLSRVAELALQGASAARGQAGRGHCATHFLPRPAALFGIRWPLANGRGGQQLGRMDHGGVSEGSLVVRAAWREAEDGLQGRVPPGQGVSRPGTAQVVSC